MSEMSTHTDDNVGVPQECYAHGFQRAQPWEVRGRFPEEAMPGCEWIGKVGEAVERRCGEIGHFKQSGHTTPQRHKGEECHRFAGDCKQVCEPGVRTVGGGG